MEMCLTILFVPAFRGGSIVFQTVDRPHGDHQVIKLFERFSMTGIRRQGRSRCVMCIGTSIVYLTYVVDGSRDEWDDGQNHKRDFSTQSNTMYAKLESKTFAKLEA